LLRGDQSEDASAEVIEAIQSDSDLTASQRRSLIEAYQALRRVTLKHRKGRGAR